mmetsp:Transcript_11647/g.27358  ORF Transcript_11647/g.27358 Transcript_11647/m.27358 type:complete len:240 (+) Transcript_11647:159-878(+)
MHVHVHVQHVRLKYYNCRASHPSSSHSASLITSVALRRPTSLPPSATISRLWPKRSIRPAASLIVAVGAIVLGLGVMESRTVEPLIFAIRFVLSMYRSERGPTSLRERVPASLKSMSVCEITPTSLPSFTTGQPATPFATSSVAASLRHMSGSNVRRSALGVMNSDTSSLAPGHNTSSRLKLWSTVRSCLRSVTSGSLFFWFFARHGIEIRFTAAREAMAGVWAAPPNEEWATTPNEGT